MFFLKEGNRDLLYFVKKQAIRTKNKERIFNPCPVQYVGWWQRPLFPLDFADCEGSSQDMTLANSYIFFKP